MTKWAFLDKDAAYDVFKRIFRYDPDLVNSTVPSDLSSIAGIEQVNIAS